MNRYHKQDITGADPTDPVEATKKTRRTRQRQRGATHETRPDTTKHRARKGVLLSGVASTTRGWGDPSRQPQRHLHRLFASQERDQMKDPRKSWGLSDTCHREPVNSSLSKAKCFNITTLIPKNYSRSSLPSCREQRPRGNPSAITPKPEAPFPCSHRRRTRGRCSAAALAAVWTTAGSAAQEPGDQLATQTNGHAPPPPAPILSLPPENGRIRPAACTSIVLARSRWSSWPHLRRLWPIRPSSTSLTPAEVLCSPARFSRSTANAFQVSKAGY
jgi:hypothetical protein